MEFYRDGKASACANVDGEQKKLTRLASPHIAEDLNMARNLLLGTLDAGLLEMLDKKLVPPTATATRVGCPG